MAIDKKLIFWKKQSTFNAPIDSSDTTGSVLWYSIVFFKDTGKIWTNGTFYNCTDDWESITNKPSTFTPSEHTHDGLTPFVAGTQLAATGSWTGIASSVDALYDGLTINYWLPYAGSGNATLNLTLKGGGTTGAINCYYGGASRLTTHYGAGNIIKLTYRINANINGTAYTGWWADANYDTSDNYTHRRYGIYKIGPVAIAANTIVAYNSDGLIVNALTTPFQLNGSILWCGSAYSANTTSSNANMYEAHYSVSISGTGFTGLTLYKPLYLKGTVSGDTFTPIGLTQTEPTTEDNYVYIMIGVPQTTTNTIQFYFKNFLYIYKDGSMRLYGGYSESTGKLATSVNVTVGGSTKSFDGASALAFTLAEIGAAATNQTMYIGTTALAINRASATLSLTGVNIDGYSKFIQYSGSSLITAPGTGQLRYDYAIGSSTTGLFPAINNANAIITINKHSGSYDSQLGFSSNGDLYYRSFSATEINTTQPWKTIIDSGNIGSQSVNYATSAASATYAGSTLNWSGQTYNTTVLTNPLYILGTRGTQWQRVNLSDFSLSGHTHTLSQVLSAGNDAANNIIISGGSTNHYFERNFKFNDTSGGWARDGFKMHTEYSVESPFTIGMLGSGSSYTYSYLGFEGYNSSKNLRIYPSGTVSATTFLGALSGNATSATKLQTARTVAGVSFDGSANIAIPFANLANRPNTLAGYGVLATDTMLTAKNASLVTSTTTTGITNVATNNTNTYLNIVQGGSASSSTKISGAGSVTLSSDINGAITIHGSENITYSAGTKELLQLGIDTTNRVWSSKTLKDWYLEESAILLDSVTGSTFSSNVIDLTNVNGAFNVDSANNYTTYTLSNIKVRGAWARVLVNSSIPITITGIKLINLGSTFEVNTNMYLNVMYDGINTLGYYTKVVGNMTPSYYINTSSGAGIFTNTNTPIYNFCTSESAMNIEGVSVSKNIIKDIYFSNEYSNTTSIGHNFLISCTSLKSLDLSLLTNVTSIGDNFLTSCTSLTSIDLSLLNVTSISHNFLSGCTSLTSIDLSPLTNVTTIGIRFLNGCTSLTSIDLSLLTNVTSIGHNFLTFSGVNTLKMGAVVPPSLSYPLPDTLTSILVPSAAVNAYKSATYWSAKASIISGY